MKKAKIFHNPKAGAGTLDKETLCKLLAEAGYSFDYSSVKDPDWKNIPPDVDFMIVAGGDGTVRKVAVELLAEQHIQRLPIVLLPAGTANNIARSLSITGLPADIVGRLRNGRHHHKLYDAGTIQGLPGFDLFIESIGVGIFPELMKHMAENVASKDLSPQEEINKAQRVLHRIIKSHPAISLEITVDGEDHSGEYLMAEIMNIGSLGPNLQLSAAADPGDGIFDLVLIPEERREDMAAHVSMKAAGIDKSFHPSVIRGKNIHLAGQDIRLHIDDQKTEVLKKLKIALEPLPGAFEFVVMDA